MRVRKSPFEEQEKENYKKGYRLIAGADEAGRGSLAGPVTVGFIIYPASFFEQPLPASLANLDDSKQLSPAEREEYFSIIKDSALYSSALHISSHIIDRLGINRAILQAILRNLVRCKLQGFSPDLLLMDGNYRFPDVEEKGGCPMLSFIKGDGRIFSIAAASILAKVSRDRRMIRYAKRFPEYGFEKHKGYGTKMHRDAIKVTGASPIHRRSYKW